MDRRSLLTAGLFGLCALAFTGAVRADEADNVEIAKAYVAAWNAHDIDAAAGFFTDDVVYFDASVGDPVTGKDNARAQVVANFINAAPDLTWEMLGEPIAQDDMLAFQWRFSGTNTGAWADGSEATNESFFILGATIMSIADGKIRSQSDYYDAMGLYEDLGWIDDEEAGAE